MVILGGTVVTTITSLSMSAISTNGVIKGGTADALSGSERYGKLIDEPDRCRWHILHDLPVARSGVRRFNWTHFLAGERRGLRVVRGRFLRLPDGPARYFRDKHRGRWCHGRSHNRLRHHPRVDGHSLCRNGMGSEGALSFTHGACPQNSHACLPFQAQVGLLFILVVAILDFLLGTFIGPKSDEERAKGFVGYDSKEQ